MDFNSGGSANRVRYEIKKARLADADSLIFVAPYLSLSAYLVAEAEDEIDVKLIELEP